MYITKNNIYKYIIVIYCFIYNVNNVNLIILSA